MDIFLYISQVNLLYGPGKEAPWISFCTFPKLINNSITSMHNYYMNPHTWFIYLHESSPLQWRHNECDGVSNHKLPDCLLNLFFRRRSKKTSKLRVTGFCEGNSPVTGEFPAQRASNAENISIWWRHHTSKCQIKEYVIMPHVLVQLFRS